MSVEQPMNEVESELRALLAVEPSPEFAARVRQHVRGQQMSRGFRTAGWLLAAGAALVTVVVAALSLRMSVPPDAAPRVAASRRVDVVLPLESRSMTPPEDVAAAGKPVVRPPVRARIAQADRVLFDDRQRIAIERLMELARAGTVLDLPDAAEPAPLAVEPLSVPPIVIETSAVPDAVERSSW
jgi:hypothetical protein